MAKRRMFALTVVDSDAFLDMPLSTQALYFHLGMHADDEGFVGNPKRIRKNVGASEDDLKLLLAKGFLMAFDSGVMVIKHWKVNNYLQSDRFSPTSFVEERSQIHVEGEKIYAFGSDKTAQIGVQNMADVSCIQNVYKSDTECIHSIGKVSIDKNSVVLAGAPAREENNNNDIPSKEEINDFFKKQNEPQEAEMFIAYNEAFSWEKVKKYGWKRIAMLWLARKKDKDKNNDKEASKKSASSIASFLFSKNDKAYTPEQINEFFTGFNPDEV